MNEEEAMVKLMLDSALPIDEIDQMTMLPGQTLILVWIDIQDRPDLSDLGDLAGPGKGTFLMTWFAANPGSRKMIIGLRVELEATSVIFHLAFRVERYLPELEILAQTGQLWVVPGPPNENLTGTKVLSTQEMIAVVGKGVQLELEPDMRSVLQNMLGSWKRRK